MPSDKKPSGIKPKSVESSPEVSQKPQEPTRSAATVPNFGGSGDGVQASVNPPEEREAEEKRPNVAERRATKRKKAKEKPASLKRVPNADRLKLEAAVLRFWEAEADGEAVKYPRTVAEVATLLGRDEAAVEAFLHSLFEQHRWLEGDRNNRQRTDAERLAAIKPAIERKARKLNTTVESVLEKHRSSSTPDHTTTPDPSQTTQVVVQTLSPIAIFFGIFLGAAVIALAIYLKC